MKTGLCVGWLIVMIFYSKIFFKFKTECNEKVCWSNYSIYKSLLNCMYYNILHLIKLESVVETIGLFLMRGGSSEWCQLLSYSCTNTLSALIEQVSSSVLCL